MPDIAIRAAYSDSISYGHKVEDGVQSLVDQINNRTSTTATSLSSVAVPNGELDRGTTQALYDSAVEWLEQNGYIVDKDLVIFGHGHADFGFGKSHDTYVNGKHVQGGISYADYLASPLLAEIFAIHELGHGGPFGLGHDSGHVETNYNDEVTTVTPMAAAYVEDASGICDTEACGSGPLACGGGKQVNGDFCGEEYPIYENGTASGFADCPIHTTTISDCYVSAVESVSYNSPR